jgi:hypothetical protein
MNPRHMTMPLRALHLPLALSVVAGTAFAQTNLALSGIATQSTTDFGGVASRAIDGDTNPQWASATLTHTGDFQNSWWEVDLGATEVIGEIKLFNRGDCCWERLSNFRVSVFDGTSETYGEDVYVGSGNVPQAGSHSVFPVSGTRGNRVRVSLLGLNNAGNGFLTLAEVEVYDGAIGTSYCGPAVANSTGASATMLATGSIDVTDNDVTLTAAGLPTGSFGYFLTSRTQGLLQQPGGSQGVFCLGGAIGSFFGPGQVKNAGALGAFELAIDLTQIPQPAGAVAVVSGETWSFQCWYRDSVSGAATSNFTDGCAVTFL